MMMVPCTTRLDLMILLVVVQTSTLNLRVMDSHGVGWETERIFLVARAVSQLPSQSVPLSWAYSGNCTDRQHSMMLWYKDSRKRAQRLSWSNRLR